MLRHVGVCMRARCAAQGLYSIPGQSQPSKVCSLTLRKTKFIMYKLLALQKAAVSMHYTHIESFKSYCERLFLKLSTKN